MRGMQIHLVLASVLCLVGSRAVFGQVRPTAQRGTDTASSAQRPAPSELEKQNADRVSASPEQIREVLVKDPGLLVELKHWMAKEATANGQLIDDYDLADQSIFDRLGNDIIFRAAATRLVQRFGYLLPS